MPPIEAFSSELVRLMGRRISQRQAAESRGRGGGDGGLHAAYQAQQAAERTISKPGFSRRLYDRAVEDDRMAARVDREHTAGLLQEVGAQKRVGGTPTSASRAPYAQGRVSLRMAATAGPQAEARARVSGAAGTLELQDGEIIQTGMAEGVAGPPQGAIQGTGVYSQPQEELFPPQIDAMLAYLDARRYEIPEQEWVGLEGIVKTGSMTANQLAIRADAAAKPIAQEGRTQAEIEKSVVRLQTAMAKLGVLDDPGGDTRRRMGNLLDTEQRRLRERREGTNPIRNRSIANPDPDPDRAVPPPGLGHTMSESQMRYFLNLANGDPDEATRMATEQGWVIPD